MLQKSSFIEVFSIGNGITNNTFREASGGRNWEGKLSRVAIYSRFVGAEEAAHKFKLIQGE